MSSYECVHSFNFSETTFKFFDINSKSYKIIFILFIDFLRILCCWMFVCYFLINLNLRYIRIRPVHKLNLNFKYSCKRKRNHFIYGRIGYILCVTCWSTIMSPRVIYANAGYVEFYRILPKRMVKENMETKNWFWKKKIQAY